MNTQEIEKQARSFRIYIPSNWDWLTSIPIGGKPLRDRGPSVMMLKYLLHGCYTAQFYRDDGFPLSYMKAEIMCSGDRHAFSKLKKALLEVNVITSDNVCKYREKAFHYSLGAAMKKSTWALSKHMETFTLPVFRVEQAVSEGDLTVDLDLLESALEFTAKARGWEPKSTEFWRLYLTDNWNNEVHGSKTGRIYGTWCRVPRELRGVFLIKGEPVVEVDIKSSQPTLLVNLYKDRCSNECQRFIKIIKAGKFYEVVMHITGIESRDVAKEKTMKFLCGKRKSNPEILTFFEKVFPELLTKMLDKWPHEDDEKTPPAKYKALSWWLQRQEATIIVNRICKDFPVFSMHDGVICQASIAEEVKKATEKALFDVCGIHGIVTIENKREPLETANPNPELTFKTK